MTTKSVPFVMDTKVKLKRELPKRSFLDHWMSYITFHPIESISNYKWNQKRYHSALTFLCQPWNKWNVLEPVLLDAMDYSFSFIHLSL